MLAAVATSSSSSTIIGTLLHPGDFRIRSNCVTVLLSASGELRSVFVMTTTSGMRNAIARPRCSRVVPAMKKTSFESSFFKKKGYNVNDNRTIIKESYLRSWNLYLVSQKNYQQVMGFYFGNQAKLPSNYELRYSTFDLVHFSSFRQYKTVYWLTVAFLRKDSASARQSTRTKTND